MFLVAPVRDAPLCSLFRCLNRLLAHNSWCLVPLCHARTWILRADSEGDIVTGRMPFVACGFRFSFPAQLQPTISVFKLNAIEQQRQRCFEGDFKQRELRDVDTRSNQNI